MATATILNLLALCFGLGSAVTLAFSPNPLLNVLEKASSPTVVSVGRGPDMDAISQLGQDVRAGAAASRRRVRIGCVGLSVGFLLQAMALFV